MVIADEDELTKHNQILARSYQELRGRFAETQSLLEQFGHALERVTADRDQYQEMANKYNKMLGEVRTEYDHAIHTIGENQHTIAQLEHQLVDTQKALHEITEDSHRYAYHADELKEQLESIYTSRSWRWLKRYWKTLDWMRFRS